MPTDRAAYAALDEQHFPFDILLLDVDLGEGTTGFDIARYGRGKNPHVGIIISSGSPPESLGSFSVEGAVFVPKPCNEATLLSALDDAASGGGPTP